MLLAQRSAGAATADSCYAINWEEADAAEPAGVEIVFERRVGIVELAIDHLVDIHHLTAARRRELARGHPAHREGQVQTRQPAAATCSEDWSVLCRVSRRNSAHSGVIGTG